MATFPEQAEAFRAALLALGDRYPATGPRAYVAANYRDIMANGVNIHSLKSTIALSEAAQLPRDEVEALVTIIYG